MNGAAAEDWRVRLSQRMKISKEDYLIELTRNEDNLNGSILHKEISGLPLEFFMKETTNDNGVKCVMVAVGCAAGKAVHDYKVKMGVIICMFDPIKDEHVAVNVNYHDISPDLPSMNKGVRLSMARLDAFIDARGNIRATARIYIHSTKGLRKANGYDFTAPSDDSDVVFIVGDDKFYANRSYLSMVSPYFKAMFSGNFDEATKGEITLRDIDPQEFMIFLYACYPSFTGPNDDTVENLLRTADMYQVNFITNQCEKFLLDNNTRSEAALLRIADTFHLVGLQGHIFSSLTTTAAIKRLMESAEASEFSIPLKLALFDLLVKKTDG